MACRSFRDVVAEDQLRKAALVGRDATADQRLAALVARMRARESAGDNLSVGARMLLDAVQDDGDRYGFLRKS